MKIKAKDIANRLGLSTATISIILNGKTGVSQDTRDKVLAEIKALGAEYLLNKKTPIASHEGHIGLVIYKRDGKILNEDPFFSYSLNSINGRLQESGYILKLINVDISQPREKIRQQIIQSGCDGLIIYAVEMIEEDLAVFDGMKIPFVLLDNSFLDKDVDSIAINNSQGIRTAIDYLYHQGHRKIGYLKSKTSIASFEERFQSYTQYLEALGLTTKPEFILSVGYSENEATIDTLTYIDNCLDEMPTAFISDNDLICCYAMRAFQQKNYRIPTDISFIGFDNRTACTIIEPKLTTIEVPKDLFSLSAVDLLMQKLNTERNYSLKLSIGTQLVERQSVTQINIG